MKASKVLWIPLWLVIAVAILFAFSGCGGGPAGPVPPPSSVTVSPTSLSFPASGGSKEVTVTVNGNVSWTVNLGAGWLSVSPTSGTTTTTVTVTAQANTVTVQQMATLTIGGQSVSVTEDAKPPFKEFTVVIPGASTPGVMKIWEYDPATGRFVFGATGPKNEIFTLVCFNGQCSGGQWSWQGYGGVVPPPAGTPLNPLVQIKVWVSPPFTYDKRGEPAYIFTL